MSNTVFLLFFCIWSGFCTFPWMGLDRITMRGTWLHAYDLASFHRFGIGFSITWDAAAFILRSHYSAKASNASFLYYDYEFCFVYNSSCDCSSFEFELLIL